MRCNMFVQHQPVLIELDKIQAVATCYAYADDHPNCSGVKRQMPRGSALWYHCGSALWYVQPIRIHK